MAIEIPRSRLPAELIVTDDCVRMIKHFEGFRPVAYKDPVGIWTIGYGFTEGVKPGDTITLADADERLRKELEEHAQIVRDAIPDVPLSQGQFNALVSYVYNIGRILETLLAKLKARDYAGAQAEFPRACRADGQPLKGIYRRRLAECCMWSGLPWEGATAPHLIKLASDKQGRLDFTDGKTTTLEETLERARNDTASADIRAKFPGAPPIIPSPAPSVPPPVVKDELVLDKPAPIETAPLEDGPAEAGPVAVDVAPMPTPPPVAPPPVAAPPVIQRAPPPPLPVVIAPKEPADAKNPLGSQTIWGGLLTALAPELDKIGNTLMGFGATMGPAILTLGLIMIVLGRIGATQPLSTSAPIRKTS